MTTIATLPTWFTAREDSLDMLIHFGAEGYFDADDLVEVFDNNLILLYSLDDDPCIEGFENMDGLRDWLVDECYTSSDQLDEHFVYERNTSTTYTLDYDEDDDDRSRCNLVRTTS
jgi:hypothetical protein